MAQNAVVQLRRDTAANWTSVDPVLELGEAGIETDTNRWKVGDGSTAWTSLVYMSGDVHYRYGLNGCDNILANEVLLDHLVIRDHLLDADFATTLIAAVLTNPTANPWVVSVYQNVTLIGTISVSSAGAVTLATVGNVDKPISAGDRVQLIAPATADATVAGFAATFEGIM